MAAMEAILLGRSPPERYPPTPPPSPALMRRQPSGADEEEPSEAEWGFVLEEGAASESSSERREDHGALYTTTSAGLPGLRNWADGFAHGVLVSPFVPLDPPPPLVVLPGPPQLPSSATRLPPSQPQPRLSPYEEQQQEQQEQQAALARAGYRACDSVRCHKCGAFVCQWTHVDGLEPPDGAAASEAGAPLAKDHAGRGRWHCAFCGAANQSKYRGASSRSEFAELFSPVVHYFEPASPPPPSPSLLTAALSPFSPTTPPTSVDDEQVAPTVDADECVMHWPSGGSKSVVLCLDVHLADDDKSALVGALQEQLADWSDDVAVALVTFGSIVKVFDLKEEAASVSCCFPGKRSLSADEVDSLQRGDGWFLRMDSAGKRRIVGVVRQALAGRPGGSEQRCTGTAVEAVIALARQRSASALRCLIVASGPPQELVNPLVARKLQAHLPPEKVAEARSRLGELARLACAVRLGVDFIGVGHRHFNVHLLQALTRPTNGLAVLLRKPNKTALRCLLHRAVQRPSGLTASLGVACSSPAVELRHLIGPVFSDGAQAADRGAVVLQHQWRMTNDAAQGVLFLFDVGDLADDARAHVLFQFVAQRSSRRGTLYRVWTVRQPVLASPQQFYRAIQPNALAVCFGKTYTLEARKLAEHSTAFTTSALIFELFDRHCQRLLRTLTQLSRDCERTLFDQTARQLFLLRHSVLLSETLQHPDDIDILRAVYLNAAFETALHMQAPTLLVFRGSEPPVAVAPDTLAMQSDCVLLLDQHSDVFVWVGAQARGTPAEQRAWSAASSLAAQRFPYPQLMKFDEGASMARWLSSRLVPSHLDPWVEAVKSLPQLLSLSESARRQLYAKFHKTDDLSYFRWLQHVLPTD